MTVRVGRLGATANAKATASADAKANGKAKATASADAGIWLAVSGPACLGTRAARHLDRGTSEVRSSAAGPDHDG